MANDAVALVTEAAEGWLSLCDLPLYVIGSVILDSVLSFVVTYCNLFYKFSPSGDACVWVWLKSVCGLVNCIIV